MRSKKLSRVVFAVFAILLLGSMSAFAVKPPPPIQTPLSPTKIPQFAQPLDTLLAGIPVVLNPLSALPTDISICEYQVNVLPPNTPYVGGVPDPITGIIPPPKTWVFGYQNTTGVLNNACDNGYIPNRSYLGPAIVAARGTPAEINFYNKLPDASQAKVPAYTTSVDQTVIWGDPLSLNSAATGVPFTKIDGALVWAPTPNPDYDPNLPLDPVTNPEYLPPLPEDNECWLAQQLLVPPATFPVGSQCLNNYGFGVLQPAPNTYPPKYVAPIPAAVHLHGGEVPSVLDGGPDAWWTANGIYGHGFYSKGGVADAALGKATYVYPNVQEAAPTWFHDHMLGATRLNVYAGIAGAYVQIDPAMMLATGLHALGIDTDGNGSFTDAANNFQVNEFSIPLIVQDRMFDTNGQLYFPNIGINPEHPYWVPEFVGDTIAVNGKVWPFLTVQPRRYKFIFLNGSNARSYEMFFNKGPSMWVIGNDGGYLQSAQLVNPAAKANSKLLMMPGERYEVVIDFTAFAGKNLILQNTAQVPWGGPGFGGAPVNGTTTGRIMQFRVQTLTQAGLPATFMDKGFNPAMNPAVRTAPIPMVRLTTADVGGTTPAVGVTIHKTRRLTLNEVIAAGGPLEILQNNTLYDGTKPLKYAALPNRTDFTPVAGLTGWNTSYYTEMPYEGETELWEIVNLTADAHPIHPHLVDFQVLNRQALDVKLYTAAYDLAYGQPNGLPLDGYGPPYNYNNSGSVDPLCSATAPGRFVPQVLPADPVDPYSGLNPLCVLGGNPDPANINGAVPPALPTTALVGLPLAPNPQEIGWKDTVQSYAGMVTRVLVRFARVTEPANADPKLIGYEFDPNHGHGYVWHCHIVDHEDNEMMRPFSVTPNLIDRSFIQGPGPGQY